MNKLLLFLGSSGTNQLIIEGIKKDIQNFHSFACSPLGGSWNDDESEMIFISDAEITGVNEVIKLLHNFDYVLLIYSGHGYVEASSGDTKWILKGGELSLRKVSSSIIKGVIISDCCRDFDEIALTQSLHKISASEASSRTLGAVNSRACYEKHVMSSRGEVDVLHACGLNQKSGISAENGSHFISALLRAAEEWRNEIRTIAGIGNCEVLDISDAFTRARKIVATTNSKQRPTYEITKALPCHPFAVASFKKEVRISEYIPLGIY